MSVNVDTRVVGPGEADFAEAAWDLKEHIRREEGVLKQRRSFFSDAYRRSTVYILIEEGVDDSLIGFASTRRDGYILFLAVDPEHRGRGFGRQLIANVAEDYDTVSCHARTTNDAAVEFYTHVGFEVKRRVDNYYEDGGAAYYLTLGAEGLAARLSNRIF